MHTKGIYATLKGIGNMDQSIDIYKLSDIQKETKFPFAKPVIFCPFFLGQLYPGVQRRLPSKCCLAKTITISISVSVLLTFDTNTTNNGALCTILKKISLPKAASIWNCGPFFVIFQAS